MAEQKQRPSLLQFFAEKRHSRMTKLDDINAVVCWKPIEKLLAKTLKRTKSAVGVPAYPAIVMFKCLLLQRLYNISDVELEEALYDRISFVRFVGLTLDNKIPDATTICRFRNELVEHKLAEKLFGEIIKQVQSQGLHFKEGIIVDASVIGSSRHPRKVVDCAVVDRKEEETTALESTISYSDDKEAAWTVKGNKVHFGYKIHMTSDAKTGLVLGGHITPANHSDTGELACLIKELPVFVEGPCFADKGYCSHKNSLFLQEHAFEDGIMDKAVRGRPLDFMQKIRNHCISKVRGGIERIFGTFKRRYRFDRSRYVGMEKVSQEFFLVAFCYNVNRILKLI